MVGSGTYAAFLSGLREDFCMVGEDLFKIFPDSFRKEELYFFAELPALFPFPDWQEEEKVLIGKISIILYVSMKLHILVASPKVNKGHRLEMAVLAGDYLSGRFTQLCVQTESFELFDAWLDYLLRLSRNLAALSLEKASLDEKHHLHRVMLMEMILRLNGTRDRETTSEALGESFESGHWASLAEDTLGLKMLSQDALARLQRLSTEGKKAE